MSFVIATLNPTGATGTVRTLVGPSNPLPVTLGRIGTAPADHSVNPVAVPESGLFLLSTIFANPTRASVTVQNQGPQMLQLVLDDGGPTGSNLTLAQTGGTGSTGTVSSYLLPGTTGTTGAPVSYREFTSNTFKGRVSVYGYTGAGASIAAAFEN